MYRPDTSDKPTAHRPATLEALSWAAEKAGVSYGHFILSLTYEDKQRIQLEFEKYRKDRAKADAERRVVRSSTSDAVTGKGWKAYAAERKNQRAEAALLDDEDS